MIAALQVVLATVLVALLEPWALPRLGGTLPHASQPGYVYDGHHTPVMETYIITERGPLEWIYESSTRDAVDGEARGASEHIGSSSPPAQSATTPTVRALIRPGVSGGPGVSRAADKSAALGIQTVATTAWRRNWRLPTRSACRAHFDPTARPAAIPGGLRSEARA